MIVGPSNSSGVSLLHVPWGIVSAAVEGLGDTTTDGTASTGFDTSFATGSMLTAFLVGLGVIIAAKTVFAPSRARSGKKWAAGAWRNEDYEDWPEYERRRTQKRRRKAA